MNVTAQNYTQLAMRTASPWETKKDGLLHAGLGIGSEIGELASTVFAYDAFMQTDTENIAEEVGDVFWYVALLSSVCKWDVDFDALFPSQEEFFGHVSVDFATFPETKLRHYFMLAQHYAGEVLTQIKAFAYYGKEIDDDAMIHAVSMTLGSLQKVIRYFGKSEIMAMEANVKKLQKRYPEQFTQEDAVARADKNIMHHQV